MGCHRPHRIRDQDVADLRGKRIGINAYGSAVDLALRVRLKKEGMDPKKDVQIVEIAFPNIGPALREKRIDAGVLILPFMNAELQKGGLRPVFDGGDAFGPYSVIFHVVTNSFLKANREAVRAFLADYVLGLQWFYDLANRKRAVEITAEFTKSPAAVLDQYFMTARDYYRDRNAAHLPLRRERRLRLHVRGDPRDRRCRVRRRPRDGLGDACRAPLARCRAGGGRALMESAAGGAVNAPARLGQAAWRAVRFTYPIALVVLVWALAARSGWVRPLFLPSPQAVAEQFWPLLGGGEIVKPLAVSLWRAFGGLVMALVVGAAAGLAMARMRWMRWGVDPLVSFAFPAPKIAFMPIFILWFGIDDVSKILLVAFTCVFPIIVATYHGAIAVSRTVIWSAQAMGTSERTLLRRVVLPATLPYIFSGLRVTVPVALITAYTAEMVAGGGGLGSALMFAQRFFQTPAVFLYIILMLLSGVVLDQVMLAARSRLIPWQPEEDA